jgi:hypothetical protein
MNEATLNIEKVTAALKEAKIKHLDAVLADTEVSKNVVATLVDKFFDNGGGAAFTEEPVLVPTANSELVPMIDKTLRELSLLDGTSVLLRSLTYNPNNLIAEAGKTGSAKRIVKIAIA